MMRSRFVRWFRSLFHHKVQLQDSGWANLSVDIGELILQRLCIMDQSRFGAVCSNWRTIFANARAAKRCSPAPQLPFFLCEPKPRTTGSANHHLLTLVSHEEPRPIRTYTITDSESCRCIGSVEGWLIFIDAYNSDFVFFSHPVLGAKVMLPRPIPGELLARVDMLSKEGLFRKAIASSRPDSPDCIVVALLYGTQRQQLAYCKVNDEFWDVIEEGNARGMDFQDIVFHDNKLYAVSFDLSDFVMIFHFEGPNAIIAERFVILHPQQILRPAHLVQNNGILYNENYEVIKLASDSASRELLLVLLHHNLLYSNGRTHDPSNFQPVKGFRVFKLDMSNQQWVQVDSLGDKSLFWDGLNCEVIPTTLLDGPEELFHRNLIFFAVKYLSDSQKKRPSLYKVGILSLTDHSDSQNKWQFLYDIGMFSLIDQSLQRFPHLNSLVENVARIVWFKPRTL